MADAVPPPPLVPVVEEAPASAFEVKTFERFDTIERLLSTLHDEIGSQGTRIAKLESSRDDGTEAKRIAHRTSQEHSGFEASMMAHLAELKSSTAKLVDVESDKALSQVERDAARKLEWERLTTQQQRTRALVVALSTIAPLVAAAVSWLAGHQHIDPVQTGTAAIIVVQQDGGR